MQCQTKILFSFEAINGKERPVDVDFRLFEYYLHVVRMKTQCTRGLRALRGIFRTLKAWLIGSTSFSFPRKECSMKQNEKTFRKKYCFYTTCLPTAGYSIAGCRPMRYSGLNVRAKVLRVYSLFTSILWAWKQIRGGGDLRAKHLKSRESANHSSCQLFQKI